MTTPPIIAPQQLELNEQTCLLDVREPAEFNHEHIAGAINLPLAQLPQAAEAYRGKEAVVLTCQSGARAMQAAQLLQAQGFTNLHLLNNGLLGWKTAHLPTVKLRQGYSIMQQVQLIVGAMVLASVLLPSAKVLGLIAGVGMLTAGLTNTCMMATLLAKLPFNQHKTPSCNVH
jgi:rhodanese-related sulfurtransferase